jgi:DeoR family transcriptional regulator, fructose operon transcriptional repressor
MILDRVNFCTILCESVQMRSDRPPGQLRPGLLDIERRERIVAHLRSAGTARVADLAAALGVSAMTVRRDADRLEADSRIERVRGGVRLLRPPLTDEPEPLEKAVLHRAAKERIARAALELVPASGAVGVGAGTTTLALARLLADLPGVTIVTNSLPVALAIPRRDGVVLTGGERTRSDALVGPIANRTAAAIGLDVLFLGAHGFDSERGCTAPNLAEAETNRALMGAARRTVALVDSSKWGVQGLATFARLEEFDAILTDDAMDAAAARLARRAGARIALR